MFRRNKKKRIRNRWKKENIEHRTVFISLIMQYWDVDRFFNAVNVFIWRIYVTCAIFRIFLWIYHRCSGFPASVVSHAHEAHTQYPPVYVMPKLAQSHRVVPIYNILYLMYGIPHPMPLPLLFVCICVECVYVRQARELLIYNSHCERISVRSACNVINKNV